MSVDLSIKKNIDYFMVRGQSIKIFLVDGTPSGIKAVELSNWTGKGIVFSKGLISQLAQRKEAFKPGIYILTGADPENISRNKVYIGEAENIFNRMKQHSNDESKDFWENTVFFTSKDENLTKSHIKYLESRIISISKESGRQTIANSTSPEPTPLPESEIADMETFLDHMKMILPIMGFDFMEPSINTKYQNDFKFPLFHMNPVGTNASAKVINGKLIVLKGSTARKEGVKTWTSYKSLREELIMEKVLISQDEKIINLQEIMNSTARQLQLRLYLLATKMA